MCYIVMLGVWARVRGGKVVMLVGDDGGAREG